MKNKITVNKLIAEGHSTLGLLPLWRAQPWVDDFTNTVHQLTNRSGIDLNQIDIFGITNCGQVQLKQRRTTTKSKVPAQYRVVKYVNECPANHQILLDLIALCPGCSLAPLSD